MLAIGSCITRVRRELQGSADAAINFRLELLASIVLLFNNNHGQSLPTLSLHAAKSKMFIMCIKAISSFMLCSFGISIEASAQLRCFHYSID